MKNIILTICLTFTLIANSAYASEAGKATNLNYIMTDIGKIVVKLYPLLVAKRELTEKDTRYIDQAITKLSQKFQQAQPYITARSDTYQISYEFISQYLQVLKTVVKTTDVDYTRSYLNALGEICSTCHTQDTTLRTLFHGATREDFDSDFAFAELNYMTREYDTAVSYYEKSLDSPQRKTELDIIQPLQRIMTIYLQIKNNPAKAISILNKYTTLKQHTALTRTEINGWLKGLQALQEAGVSRLNKPSFNTLKGFVKKYLGDPDKLSLDIQSSPREEVERVWLRGQLYHYLNRHPGASKVPIVLFWLAVTDRAIVYNFYFSLADLYLRQCVLNYPWHPYARRCFNEYKNYISSTYQRQGENIPPGLNQEIAAMEKAMANAENH
jgi:hypothetical protein